MVRGSINSQETFLALTEASWQSVDCEVEQVLSLSRASIGCFLPQLICKVSCQLIPFLPFVDVLFCGHSLELETYSV